MLSALLRKIVNIKIKNNQGSKGVDVMLIAFAGGFLYNVHKRLPVTYGCAMAARKQ